MAQNAEVDLRLERDVIVCGREAIAFMRAKVGPAAARREVGPIIDHFVFDDAGKVVSVRAFYEFG